MPVVLVSLVSLILSACGGKSTTETMAAIQPLLAPPVSLTAIASFTGMRNNYSIVRTSAGFVVKDMVGNTGAILISDSSVKFDDVTVNLLIGDKSKTISAENLRSLIELYIAFFNRVPDADGMVYWIDQIKAGTKIEALANQFYAAAILYSNVTAYSATMSNADFVKVIYLNVLGRNEVDQEGMDYWTGALAKPAGTPGAETRGTLINSIINAAHGFKGDAKYGWVADLLDNKVAVGNYFSVQQGLNYNTPEQSILLGVNIAKAVKSNDILTAKSLIGMQDAAFDLPAMTGDVVISALVARDDVLILAQDQTLTFDYLTANDTASKPSALAVIATSSPLYGSLNRVGKNTYSYKPAAGFVGEDSFSYTVLDEQGAVKIAQVSVAVNAAIDAAAVRSRLLNGVATFSDAPTRGFMSAFGPTAVNLTNFPGTQTPMAVAATLGAGRIVALPGLHWASIDKMNASSIGDMSQFFLNSLAWLSGKDSKNIRIVRNNFVEMNNWLSTKGFSKVVVSDDLVNNLSGTDVLIAWMGGNPSSESIEAVTKFVQGGGALLLVEFGAGFREHIGWWSATLSNSGGNRIMRKAGVVFGGEWNSAEAPLTVNTTKPISDEMLVSALRTPDAYSASEKIAVAENFSVTTTGLPKNDTLLARLDSSFNQIISTTTPSIAQPVTDAFSKAMLLREVQLLNDLPVQDIRAHRSAESSFGLIPASAPRLANHQVSINGNWSGMLATGMYAAPGEVVDVTVPAVLVNKGYVIRLSGHSDDIGSYNTEWRRMPSGIQRSFEITQTTTKVATPYGGAIYIDLLDGADSKTKRAYGELNVVINGAIEAPYFVLGKTSNAEWIARIRQNPAPYTELVSEHLAVSVPSSMIRNLADPEALTTYWNDFVAFQDWVGGTENYRTGPDRINFDVQISVGYLHAGYPIQGPASVEASINLLDIKSLRKEGEWGYFHEMGHEMQSQSHLWKPGYESNGFTFAGGTEVTVNIFASAALEKMAPFATPTDGWGWAAYPGRILANAKKTINDSSKPKFENKDPYPFYYSLANGFGWGMYRQVLSGYLNDSLSNASAFPKTNQDKKDQWLIRWSKLSGYNMVEYMVNRWKLEVSQTAIDTVNALGLPSWLPATTSLDNFSVALNTSKQLDLRNSGVSLSGTASFVRVTAGAKHSIVANNDGTFTFTPNPGYAGRDSFKVVYRSEVGNEVETTIYVEVGASN